MTATMQALERSVHAASLKVELVDATALRQYVPAWEKLAASAVEPNVFYEPWMLLPAIEHIRESEKLKVLLIFGPPDRDGVEPLWGFFPVEIQNRCLHLPIKTLAFWQHRYCYLTVPLVQKDWAREVFIAFWRWFEKNPLGCRILDTNYLLADGQFHAEWADAVLSRYILVINEHPRGLQVREKDFDTYVGKQLSRKRYHALRRSQDHLREQGSLVFREIKSIVEVETWIEQFLFLEAQGWKGQDGGAMAVRPQDAEYFRNIAYTGFAQDRARLLSMELNGNPIAMKLAFTAGTGAHIFKIAYDERYAKYSPGVLLELEDLESWHAGTIIQWVDSGAAARHPMYDMISNDRRVIRRTAISNGLPASDLFVSVIPALRFVRQRLMKKGSL